MAQRSSLVTDEAQVGQFLVTHLTQETFRVPVGIHRFDHTPYNKLAYKKERSINFSTTYIETKTPAEVRK